jgi:hypothetical protein
MISPQYAKWWQQQLQLQAAAKQQAWQQQQRMTPGMGQAPSPWSVASPGVNAPYPNALLARSNVPTLAEADPGNALAGFFMGNPDVSSNPLLMHALLGAEPGFANI